MLLLWLARSLVMGTYLAAIEPRRECAGRTFWGGSRFTVVRGNFYNR